MAKLPGRIQNATAAGIEVDYVSRSFCPKLSIAEDPVCGSAHCQIADYWAKKLNKTDITAFQTSKRSGYLYCKIKGNSRIAIRGNATLISIAEFRVRTW